eukprot:CAMPEP_0113942972 /NCGR_PEP_ID=MMETSP1339-20121228/14990_1 /TAXON_ID=94617 /ORGANISM="Fibrocapsa japonica" /LENGTH=119 /DNA_ID=CAMNT_0000947675 /DNA_START=179 /DNA_END=538 /DNA_ORIENTATION=+ /assembly_acc=CAM_ASM_000762
MRLFAASKNEEQSLIQHQNQINRAEAVKAMTVALGFGISAAISPSSASALGRKGRIESYRLPEDMEPSTSQPATEGKSEGKSSPSSSSSSDNQPQDPYADRKKKKKKKPRYCEVNQCGY